MEWLHESFFQTKKLAAGKKLWLCDLKQLKCVLDVLSSASGIMIGLESATLWPYLNWSTLQCVWAALSRLFLERLKRLYQDISVVQGYQSCTAHGRSICAPWFWCLSLTDLLLTFFLISASHPEANIKCNRSHVYLSKPTQKSEGFLGESAAGSQGLPSGKENKEVVFVLQFLKNQQTKVLSEYGEGSKGK